jgi:hypothetical protein
MSQESTQAPSRRGPTTWLWALIVVLLLPAVIVPLWVPLYDKTDPKLWGFPFFYWFQFAMILGAAVLTMIAYALSLVAERRRHEPAATDRGGDTR